jgi:hypothetical protein
MLASPEARAYLERLRDLLPAAEAERVVAEVESLILDRVEAEGPDVAPVAAERRALQHLGTPEALADTLGEAPLSVGVSSRRAFARWWCILGAGHLLLAIALTLGGSESAALPGLLGPLPRAPWWATLSSAVGVVLLDAGLLFLLFTLTGSWGRAGALSAPGLPRAWSRSDALRTLVLVALVAVLAHPLRDSLFAVRRGTSLTPFLSASVVALLPWLDAVLGLVALRALLVLGGRGAQPFTHVVDFLAGLAGVVALVLAATRDEIVHLPADVLGAETSGVLNHVITRGLLVVLLGAALLLSFSVVRRAVRVRQLLAA